MIVRHGQKSPIAPIVIFLHMNRSFEQNKRNIPLINYIKEKKKLSSGKKISTNTELTIHKWRQRTMDSELSPFDY